MQYEEGNYDLTDQKMLQKIAYLLKRINNALKAKEEYPEDSEIKSRERREDELNQDAEEDMYEAQSIFQHPDPTKDKHKDANLSTKRNLTNADSVEGYIHNIKNYLLSSETAGNSNKPDPGQNVLSKVLNTINKTLSKWFGDVNVENGGTYKINTNYSKLVLYVLFKSLYNKSKYTYRKSGYKSFKKILDEGPYEYETIKKDTIYQRIHRAIKNLLEDIKNDFRNFANTNEYDECYVYFMIYVIRGGKKQLKFDEKAQSIYNRLIQTTENKINDFINSENKIYLFVTLLVVKGYYDTFNDWNIEGEDKIEPQEEEEEDKEEETKEEEEEAKEEETKEEKAKEEEAKKEVVTESETSIIKPSPPGQQSIPQTQTGTVPQIEPETENIQNTEVAEAVEQQQQELINSKESETQATISTIANTMAEQLYRNEPKNFFELIKYYLARLNEQIKNNFNGADSVENDFTSAVLNRFYALFMSDQNLIYQYLRAGKEIFKDQQYISYITNNTEFLGLKISVGSLLSTYEMVAVKFNNAVGGTNGINANKIAKIGTVPNYLRAILKNGKIIGIIDESVKLSEYGFSPQRIELEQNKIINTLMNSGLLTVAMQTQKLDPSTGLPITDQYGNPLFDTTYSYKGVPLTDKEVRQIVISSLVRDFTSVLGPILTDRQLQRKRTKNYYGNMKDALTRDTQVSNLNRMPTKMKKVNIEVPQQGQIKRNYDVLSYMKQFMIFHD